MNGLYKIGVLSTAETARARVLPALDGSEVVKATAVCVENKESAEELADLFELEAGFTSSDDLFTFAGLDGVIIASPPALHLQHVELALMNNLDVLIDKPVTASAVEAERVAELVAASESTVAVAHQLRSHPALPWVKSLVGEEKLLGRPLHAQLTWCYKPDFKSRHFRWRTEPELNPGGVLGDVGIHLVDMAIALFGEPSEVKTRRRRSGFAVTETVFGHLHYDDFSADLLVSWSAPAGANHLHIWCEKGYLEIPQFFMPETATQGTITGPDGNKQTVTFGGDDLYGLYIEEFADAARRKVPFHTDVNTALASMRILEKMMKKNS